MPSQSFKVTSIVLRDVGFVQGVISINLIDFHLHMNQIAKYIGDLYIH